MTGDADDELARLDVELDRIMWLARTGRVDLDDALGVLEDHYERAVEHKREREEDDSPPAPDRVPESERIERREKLKREGGRARERRLGLDR